MEWLQKIRTIQSDRSRSYLPILTEEYSAIIGANQSSLSVQRRLDVLYEEQVD